MNLNSLSRIKLGTLPTPLVEAKRLSEALGGTRVFFKRDDQTGLGFGGNKVRKLEYLLAVALAEGADTLVATGAYQSNMAHLACAAARRTGLRPVLVLGGLDDESTEPQGNLLLDRLMGAEVHYVSGSDRWAIEDAVRRVMDELVKDGYRPFALPLGGSTPEGAVGYIQAGLELESQLWEAGLSADYVILATGTGGTQAGLELANHMMGKPWKIFGISVSRTFDIARSSVSDIFNATSGLLGLKHQAHPEDIAVLDEYIGPDYGAISPAAADAITLTAQTEGLFLDPVYTGKAMAGLIGQVKLGNIESEDCVVFVHTGGLPALFAGSHDYGL